MASEGMKKTVAKTSTTELLEAEAKNERVAIEVNGIAVDVNPRAANSGAALRALQQANNPWPMWELLVPSEDMRSELEESLPQDPELGWTFEDFMNMFTEVMKKTSGKKA